jgi:O-antigen polymerase
MMTMTFPVNYGPGRAFVRPRHDGWLLLPVVFYLLFILPVFVDNNAGSGLNMPQNLLAWSIMVFCILLTAARAAVTGRLQVARFMLPGILAVVLLMLPWLWTPSSLWQQHALPRLAGIAGALAFTFALCQVQLTSGLRRSVLAVAVCSALIQAAEAMIQAWLPDFALRLMSFDDSLPYGIFQQRNLLASWLATGYGVALYLLLTARKRSAVLVWAASLYPLCVALTLTSSRTGLLGAVTMTVLAALADRPAWRDRPRAALCRLILLSSLLATCVAISQWAMPEGSRTDLTHTLSNRERVVMLKGAVSMAADHPLIGSGLGGFEARFPDVLAQAGLQPRSSSITHPHNEALYVLDEGGAIALAGLLLLAGIWLWPAFRRDGRWLLPLLGLPIVVHMMTEYPLYLSAPHLMLLLLLFRVGLPGIALLESRIPDSLRVTVLPVVCLLMVVALDILGEGFAMQRVLTLAEADMNTGLIPSLPDADWRSLTQAERLDYDRHMLAANTPGFTSNPRAMADFTLWGNRWLAVHNDAEVSAALIFIAHRRGDWIEAERLRARASRVFIQDDRFFKGTS